MRERILEAYRGNVEAVRAEDGCLAYEAVVDVEGMPLGVRLLRPRHLRRGRALDLGRGAARACRRAAHEGVCGQGEGLRPPTAPSTSCSRPERRAWRQSAAPLVRAGAGHPLSIRYDWITRRSAHRVNFARRPLAEHSVAAPKGRFRGGSRFRMNFGGGARCAKPPSNGPYAVRCREFGRRQRPWPSS